MQNLKRHFLNYRSQRSLLVKDPTNVVNFVGGPNRPYYTALTDVVRHIDPSQLGSQYFGYIYGHVFGAARRANGGQFRVAEEEDDHHQKDEDMATAQMIHKIIEGLDEHIRRIHLMEHESPRVADFVSSALIALVVFSLVN